MTRITIPQLDVNLIDVSIACWRKQPGEAVSAGETVAELATDKAVYELEAPASGTLLEIFAAEKSVVPTGYIIGLLGAAGDHDPAIADDNAAIMAAYRPPETAAAPVRERPQRVRATPRARRLAQERGLDLAKVQAETGAEIIDETILAPYLK